VNAVRAPAIVALLALLIGALVFAADPESPRLADGMVQAVAERSGSADIWFCEGPTPESPGVDDRVVALTNPTGSVAEGRITVVDESGQRVSRTYQFEAGGRFEFRPDPFVPGGRFAAVTVDSRKEAFSWISGSWVTSRSGGTTDPVRRSHRPPGGTRGDRPSARGPQPSCSCTIRTPELRSRTSG
jgi:hypothetical protein